MVESDSTGLIEQVLVESPLLLGNGTLSKHAKKQSVRCEELDPGVSGIDDGHELSVPGNCNSERKLQLAWILAQHSKGKQELSGGGED